MRRGIGAGIAAFLLLAACAPREELPPVVDSPETAAAAPAVIAMPVMIDAPQTPAPPAAAPLQLACSAQATQGGAILCKTEALATLSLDGKPVAVADAQGVAVIGLTRSQKSPAVVGMKPVLASAEAPLSASVEVLARKDTVSKFEMECAKIAPQSKADQRKADLAWVKKDKALKEFNPPLAPVAIGKPVVGDYPLSSSFGATRTYVPKTKDCKGSTSVHNGTDIAVGKGTEIRAPMAGTVILADPDLFFEGGCIFLDLGRGLVSVTMHMSKIDVKAGDVVEQGQLLGLSGATGRVTGPHLHWAIKYRNVTSDDRGTDIWLDPVLMMNLKGPA